MHYLGKISSFLCFKESGNRLIVILFLICIYSVSVDLYIVSKFSGSYSKILLNCRDSESEFPLDVHEQLRKDTRKWISSTLSNVRPLDFRRRRLRIRALCTLSASRPGLLVSFEIPTESEMCFMIHIEILVPSPSLKILFVGETPWY